MNKKKGFLRLTLVLSIIVGILSGVIGYISEEQKAIEKAKRYKVIDTTTGKQITFDWEGINPPNWNDINDVLIKARQGFILDKLHTSGFIPDLFDDLISIKKLRSSKWSKVTAEPRYINATPEQQKYIQENWYNINIISDPRYKQEDDAQIRQDIFGELHEILPRQGISCFYSIVIGILWFIIGFISVWTIYGFIRWCIISLAIWIIAGFKTSQ